MTGKRRGRPPTPVQPHHTVAQLQAHYKTSTCPIERRRAQAIWLLLEGHPLSLVRNLTQYSDQTLRLLVQSYNEHGLSALKDHRHDNPGPPTLLTDPELLLLAQTIRHDYAKGLFWDGPRVVRFVKEELGKDIYPQRAYELLKAIAFSRQTPRPNHALNDPVKMEEFKKELLPEAVKAAQALSTRVEVWAFDEHRIGLKPILRRIWAPRGKRPIAKVHHRYEWLYLYGFVHPETGRTVWYILPEVSTVAFEKVLENFAVAVGASENKRVLLVLDGAGWHLSKGLRVPVGIELVVLPSHSPELQPAERLWELTDKPLFNRCVKDLGELQDVLWEQCVRLLGEPSLVKASTLFHWWPRLTQTN